MSKTPTLAVHQRRAEPAPKPDPWRDELDLSRTRRQDNRLIQRVSGGARVTFTLDAELQSRAVALLERYEVPYGGIVLTEVDTGDVLVMAGHTEDDDVGVAEMCLTPWAPAASVFKLVSAAALLERGVPAGTNVCYHGGLRGLRAHHIKDDPARDNRCNTLSGAIAKSINPIIGKLALRYLEREHQQSWAERFGFNRALGFDLPVTPSRAQIPADRLERARVAAGFWHTSLSPLHGALIAQVVATGGELRPPRIVARVDLPGGRTVLPRRRPGRRVIRRTTARALAKMMHATTVVGTGRRGFITRRGRPYLDHFEVAGKTGSLSRKDPYLQYSWFVGFAPVDKPRVAFAVLLGNPPRWRVKAATAARLLLAEYLKAQQRDHTRHEHPDALASTR